MVSYQGLCLMHLNTQQQSELWLCLLPQKHWTNFVELGQAADLRPVRIPKGKTFLTTIAWVKKRPINIARKLLSP